MPALPDLSNLTNEHIIVLIALVLLVWSWSIFLTTFLLPPKVVELRIDPPAGAHYLQFTEQQAEEDATTKEAINRQKVTELLYHALVFCGGECSTRQLFAAIGENWNKQYEQWPEYKAWHISKTWLEKTLTDIDFMNSGRVFNLAAGNDANSPAGAYVIIPTNAQGARRLVPVTELVQAFYELKELKAKPPAPALPPDFLKTVLLPIHKPPGRPVSDELPLAAD